MVNEGIAMDTAASNNGIQAASYNLRRSTSIYVPLASSSKSMLVHWIVVCFSCL